MKINNLHYMVFAKIVKNDISLKLTWLGNEKVKIFRQGTWRHGILGDKKSEWLLLDEWLAWFVCLFIYSFFVNQTLVNYVSCVVVWRMKTSTDCDYQAND